MSNAAALPIQGGLAKGGGDRYFRATAIHRQRPVRPEAPAPASPTPPPRLIAVMGVHAVQHNAPSSSTSAGMNPRRVAACALPFTGKD